MSEANESASETSDQTLCYSQDETISEEEDPFIDVTSSTSSWESLHEDDTSTRKRDYRAMESSQEIDAATQHLRSLVLPSPTAPPRSTSSDTVSYTPESSDSSVETNDTWIYVSTPNSGDGSSVDFEAKGTEARQSTMLDDSASPCVPAEAPALPPHYVERTDILEKTVGILTSKVQSNVEPIETLSMFLFGVNGVGKTGLASAIIRSPEIQRRFFKGIHWVTVGRGGGTCNGSRLHRLLRGLVAEVTPKNDQAASPRSVTVEESIQRLALINSSFDDCNKRLVVLDDVWEIDIILALHRAKFVLLVTSSEMNAVYTWLLKLLTSSKTCANQMTLLILRGMSAEEGHGVVPFATARDKSQVKAHKHAKLWMWNKLKPEQVDENESGAGFPLALAADETNFDRAVDFNISKLDPATTEYFFLLGVLAEGTIAPVDMLSNLWNQSPTRTERTIATLIDSCLLEEDHPGSHLYRVLSPVLAYARRKLTTLRNRDDDEGDEDSWSDITCDGFVESWTRHPSEMLAISTRRQALYLSRGDVLLRFSTFTSDIAHTTVRRSSGVALGGLRSLAALWQSVEELEGFKPAAHREDGRTTRVMLDGSTYEASLRKMGEGPGAAFGLWAAAKLLVMVSKPDEAKVLARRSIFMSNSLYSACESLADQLRAKEAMRRVSKNKDDVPHRLYARMLDEAKSRTGSCHPAVAALTSTVARCLVDQGEMAEAGVRFHEALRLLEDALGDDHPILVSTLVDRAEHLMKQPPNDFIHFGREGVRDRCLAVCSRALAILDTIEKMGIKGSRGTIIYFVRLAETLDAQGDSQKAETLYRKALTMLRAGMAHDPLYIGTVLVALADLLARKIRSCPFPTRDLDVEGPVRLYCQAIIYGVSRLVQAREMVATWRLKLASLLTDQGKYIQATAQCLRVIAFCTEKPVLGQEQIVDRAMCQLQKTVQRVDYDDLVLLASAMNSSDGPSTPVAQQQQVASSPQTTSTFDGAPFYSASAGGTVTAAFSVASSQMDVADACGECEDFRRQVVVRTADSSSALPCDMAAAQHVEQGYRQEKGKGKQKGKEKQEGGESKPRGEVEEDLLMKSLTTSKKEERPLLDEAVSFLLSNHGRGQIGQALNSERWNHEEEAKQLQDAILLSFQTEKLYSSVSR